MQKCLINGFPALVGDHIKFKNEPLFELKVGQKIVKMGNESPSNDIDFFKYPIKYVGSIQFNKSKFFAFELDKKATPNKSKTYMLYQSDGKRLFKVDYRTKDLVSLLPVFIRATETIPPFSTLNIQK